MKYAWYLGEFFIRLKWFGSLKRTSSIPSETVIVCLFIYFFFLFCSSSAFSLCSFRRHKIQWRNKNHGYDLLKGSDGYIPGLKSVVLGLSSLSRQPREETCFLWVLSTKRCWVTGHHCEQSNAFILPEDTYYWRKKTVV